MPEMNRQVLLKRRPNGMPVPDDFAIVEGPLSEPDDGQVLLRASTCRSTPTCGGGSAVSAPMRRPPKSAMSLKAGLSAR